MNFSTVLRRHARTRPGATALVCRGETLTYEELDRRVDALCHLLDDAGIGAGARIATILPNGITILVVYFAAMRVGAVFVPLNVRLSVAETKYQIEHSQASFVVVDETLLSTTSDAFPSHGVVLGRADLDARLARRGQPQARDDAPASLEDVQRIMYTSGTTDHPKGVVITHGQVWWGAMSRAIEFGLTADDVTLTVAPLYHVGGLDSFTTVALLVGGTAIVQPRFEPSDVARLLTTEGVSSTWLAPTFLRQVLDAAEEADLPVPARLRVVLGGGEKAPEPLIRRMHDRWPGAGYYDAYGLTECQGIATFLDASQALSRIGSVGRPAMGREISILAADGRSGAGVVGEVALRGPVISPGYWAADGRARRQDPGGSDGGWFRTGDVGYFDADGYLFITDRAKDMIRSGLENVASSEIERVLYEHPAVQEVAVVARPDDVWGEVPVAYVVRRSATVSADDLIGHCDQHLARFKVPKDITFVARLPRTASGKVQKHRIRSGGWDD